jgi:hypothetical protein
MTKLTMVSVRKGHRIRTWFVNLPVVDERVHLPDSMLDQMIREWNLPLGSTISIG